MSEPYPVCDLNLTLKKNPDVHADHKYYSPDLYHFHYGI